MTFSTLCLTQSSSRSNVAVDHDLHGQARLGSAVGYAKCCLMKDNVGRLHQ